MNYITFDKILDFIEECCGVINDDYSYLVEKYHKTTYTQAQVDFMQLVRGRYVEFDLIYDRGIHFAIFAKMPIDIPMMALPTCKWGYKWEDKYTKEDYPEEYKTLHYLKGPTDWLGVSK